jgi:transposase
MGRRLPIEVINQIKLRLDLDECVPDIAAALRLSKTTVYKLRLNWDLWGQPYAPPSVKLGRPSLLLEYQKQVSISGIVLRFLLTLFIATT